MKCPLQYAKAWGEIIRHLYLNYRYISQRYLITLKLKGKCSMYDIGVFILDHSIKKFWYCYIKCSEVQLVKELFDMLASAAH